MEYPREDEANKKELHQGQDRDTVASFREGYTMKGWDCQINE